MKKSILFFGILTILSSAVNSQNKGISFETGTFSEIKAKALKEDKLIFIDAYTTWCGPCKQMAKSVFTDGKVAEYYNKNFINAKIDMEKGEGIEIAKQYQVQCYPNLLFIDGNGNLVHRIAGSMTVEYFMQLGIDARTPERQFAYYAKNYDLDKNNTEFLSNYIEARERTCLKSEDIVNEYFSRQKESDLTSKANWDMMFHHLNDASSREFKYLLSNKQAYYDLYSEKIVNRKIDDINQRALFSIIKTKPFNEKYYNETKAKIELLNTPNTKLIFFEADMRLAQTTENWDAYEKLALKNVEQYYLTNANELNTVAWTFYEKIEDNSGLSKAEEWAKMACDMTRDYAYLDTYAAVLYKLGKKDLALKIANEAIETAKKQKYSADDYITTTELVKKIKELK